MGLLLVQYYVPSLDDLKNDASLYSGGKGLTEYKMSLTYEASLLSLEPKVKLATRSIE